MSERRSFLPAAGHAAALPFYDPLAHLLGATRARRELVAQAGLAPGMRVLDVGCGTGTLAIELARDDVEVVGLDPDEDALARARRKAARAGARVTFARGWSDALPWPDASFDRVFSSFVLHHVQPDERAATLAEIRRVLRPDGSFHLLDFGGPGAAPRGPFLHGGPRLQDSFDGRLLALLRDAGFADAAEISHRTRWPLPMVWYRAAR